MQSVSPKKVLMIWTLAGLVIIGVLVYIILNLQKKISAARSDIIDARVNIALNTQQKQNLSNLTQQYDKIRTDSEKLNSAFYNRSKPLVFVDRLEALTGEFDIQEDEPVVSEPSRTRPAESTYSIEEKIFSVLLHGSASNLLAFLAKFEAEPAYLLIDNLTFQQSETKEATLEINGTVPWY
jgi:hypothetical protein